MTNSISVTPWLLLGACLLSGCSHPQPPAPLPQVKVDGVGLGDTQAEVRQILGQPLTQGAAAGETQWRWEQPARQIRFLNQKVAAINGTAASVDGKPLASLGDPYSQLPDPLGTTPLERQSVQWRYIVQPTRPQTHAWLTFETDPQDRTTQKASEKDKILRIQLSENAYLQR